MSNLNKLKKDELIELAEKHEIEIDDHYTKADILEELESAGVELYDETSEVDVGVQHDKHAAKPEGIKHDKHAAK